MSFGIVCYIRVFGSRIAKKDINLIMAAETPSKVSEKQALADAERLAGAPKASPKCSSKTRTPEKTPLKRPAARRDENQRKTVKQAKALKRPASNNDSTEVAGPSVEPSKGDEETNKSTNKAKKKDQEKAQKLKIEEPQEETPDPGVEASTETADRTKETRDYAKAGYFHRNFSKLPEEAQSSVSVSCFLQVFSKKFRAVFLHYVRGRCRKLSKGRFGPREEDSVGKPSRTERFQRLLHLQLGMSGCENAVYLHGENQRFPEGSRYAQVFDDFEAWFRTSFAEGYGGW